MWCAKKECDQRFHFNCAIRSNYHLDDFNVSTVAGVPCTAVPCAAVRSLPCFRAWRAAKAHTCVRVCGLDCGGGCCCCQVYCKDCIPQALNKRKASSSKAGSGKRPRESASKHAETENDLMEDEYFVEAILQRAKVRGGQCK